MARQPVVIDGAAGEGGGQILRSSLALSILTQRPFEIHSIRARRKRPGLLRQHLTAAQAAAAISGGQLDGAQVGASSLRFAPGPARAGQYRFAVGTAGSTTLVLQTILPPLLTATGSSSVCIEGGTHNPLAPPFEFLDRCFLPVLHSMGAAVTAKLLRYGFAPAGGGCIEVSIEGGRPLRPFVFDEAIPVQRRSAGVILANLPRSIGERERDVLRHKFVPDSEPELLVVSSVGPGNVVYAEVDRGSITELAIGFGELGVKAEFIARRVVKQIRGYLAAEVPVGRHLADQLLLPMVIAGGGRFRSTPLSQHALTNIAVIEQFCDVRFDIDTNERRACVELRFSR